MKRKFVVDRDTGEVQFAVVKHHNVRGAEILDRTPVEIPLGYQRPETLEEKMRRMIAGELSRRAGALGRETLQEADDFDTGEEQDLLVSAYEDLMKPMRDESEVSRRANADVQDEKDSHLAKPPLKAEDKKQPPTKEGA